MRQIEAQQAVEHAARRGERRKGDQHAGKDIVVEQTVERIDRKRVAGKKHELNGAAVFLAEHVPFPRDIQIMLTVETAEKLDRVTQRCVPAVDPQDRPCREKQEQFHGGGDQHDIQQGVLRLLPRPDTVRLPIEPERQPFGHEPPAADHEQGERQRRRRNARPCRFFTNQPQNERREQRERRTDGDRKRGDPLSVLLLFCHNPLFPLSCTIV